MKFPGNLGDMLKQAQELQSNMESLKSDLETKTVTASSGAGMVTAEVNGAFQLVNLKIDPSVVNATEVEMLEDLVRAAVGEALRKAKDMMKEEMGKITGGISIPGFS